MVLTTYMSVDLRLLWQNARGFGAAQPAGSGPASEAERRWVFGGQLRIPCRATRRGGHRSRGRSIWPCIWACCMYVDPQKNYDLYYGCACPTRWANAHARYSLSCCMSAQTVPIGPIVAPSESKVQTAVPVPCSCWVVVVITYPSKCVLYKMSI